MSGTHGSEGIPGSGGGWGSVGGSGSSGRAGKGTGSGTHGNGGKAQRLIRPQGVGAVRKNDAHGSIAGPPANGIAAAGFAPTTTFP